MWIYPMLCLSLYISSAPTVPAISVGAACLLWLDYQLIITTCGRKRDTFHRHSSVLDRLLTHPDQAIWNYWIGLIQSVADRSYSTADKPAQCLSVMPTMMYTKLNTIGLCDKKETIFIRMLTTTATCRGKISKSRVWDKVPRGSILLFVNMISKFF